MQSIRNPPHPWSSRQLVSLSQKLSPSQDIEVLKMYWTVTTEHDLPYCLEITRRNDASLQLIIDIVVEQLD